jgi:polysaccharide chain length determinant protein (PEP-CTERM system associated)
MSNESPSASFAEWLRPIWARRKWYALVAFGAALSVALGVVVFLPNVYQSAATVLIERGQVPETLVKAAVTGEMEARLQAISQEIMSRARLEELISRFDLYPRLRGRVSTQELVDRMRRDVGLELKGVERRDRVDSATVSFNVIFRGRDPGKVSDVANALASFYVEENTRTRQRQAAATAQLLKAQLADTKTRLDAQERALGEFKNRHFGSLPEQYQTNMLTLERLQTELRLNREAQMKARERRETLEQFAAVTGTGPESPAMRLARLRQERTQLRTTYSEKYPDIVRINGEIAELERQMASSKSARAAETPATSPEDVRRRLPIREIDSDVRSLRAEEQHLRDQIMAYQGRVNESPRREQEMTNLARDYETTRELYRSLLSRIGEAELGETTEERRGTGQYRILDAAVPPLEPVAPRRGRLLLLGVVVSLVMGAAAIVVAEHLDTSFHTLDDLRAATSLPVAAAIPLIVTESDRTRRRRRFQARVALAALGMVAMVGLSFVFAHDNDRMVVGSRPVASENR